MPTTNLFHKETSAILHKQCITIMETPNMYETISQMSQKEFKNFKSKLIEKLNLGSNSGTEKLEILTANFSKEDILNLVQPEVISLLVMVPPPKFRQKIKSALKEKKTITIPENEKVIWANVVMWKKEMDGGQEKEKNPHAAAKQFGSNAVEFAMMQILVDSPDVMGTIFFFTHSNITNGDKLNARHVIMVVNDPNLAKATGKRSIVITNEITHAHIVGTSRISTIFAQISGFLFGNLYTDYDTVLNNDQLIYHHMSKKPIPDTPNSERFGFKYGV